MSASSHAIRPRFTTPPARRAASSGAILGACLAALLGACEAGSGTSDAVAGGDPHPSAVQGVIRLDIAGALSAPPRFIVFDLEIEDARRETVVDVRRVWPDAATADGTVTFRVACDPNQGLHTFTLIARGVYEARPEDLGPTSAPPPEARSLLRWSDFWSSDVACVAGMETYHYFAFPAWEAAVPRVWLELSAAGRGIADALWDVRLRRDSTPAGELGRWRLSSWSGRNGGVSQLWWEACGVPGELSPEVEVWTTLVGLYGDPLEEAWQEQYGDYGAPPAPGTLEAWPPGPIQRRLFCGLGQDTKLDERLTVARVVRDQGGVSAAFAGLTCDAGWSCGDADAPEPALTLACRGATAAEPTLYLDDLELRCEGAEPVLLDPTEGADLTVVTEGGEGAVEGSAEDDEGVGELTRVSWTYRPPLDAALLSAGPCVIEGRASAGPLRAPDEDNPVGAMIVDGAVPAGEIYPLITWRVPVSDAQGPRCEPARLAEPGAAPTPPIALSYTGTDESWEALPFQHTSR